MTKTDTSQAAKANVATGTGNMASIECPCCGCEAWYGPYGGEVYDGQPLECGCKGHISVDSESEPDVFIDDCECGR